ncbi:hypothetical protein BASA62_008666 [Batrachochytrium salamandrivorans]|nr:hypothetical protein BASA62_008666 [Batrachochytrium salamandrivorans]
MTTDTIAGAAVAAAAALLASGQGEASDRSDAWQIILKELRSTHTDALAAPHAVAHAVRASTVVGLVDAWEKDLLRSSETIDDVRCDALERDALACLSVTLFQEDLVCSLTETQLLSLLDILIQIIQCTDTGKYSVSTCQLAVWTLSSQQIPATHVIDLKANRLIEALTTSLKSKDTGLVEETLRALSRLCLQSPTFAFHASTWFGLVLDLLFSPEVSVRKGADAMLTIVAPQIIAGNDMQAASTTTNPSNILSASQPPTDFISAFIVKLQTHANDNINMMCAWGHIMVAFGVRLHKTQSLNTLLSIAEPNFNSSRPSQRISAFRAWRRLILNFSLNDHLFYSKRLKLILLPIWHCLRLEKKASVREAAFETFVYLVVHLSHRSLPVSNFLESYILHTLPYLKTSERMLQIFLSIVGDLMDSSVSLLSNESAFLLLDESAVNMCNQINGNIPPEIWSHADFEAILQCLKSTHGHLEYVKDHCHRIWGKVCDSVQSSWDNGLESANTGVRRLVDFLKEAVAHDSATSCLACEVYLPGIISLAFDAHTPTAVDMDLFRYILDELQVYFTLDLSLSLSTSLLQFYKLIMNFIPKEQISSNIQDTLTQAEDYISRLTANAEVLIPPGDTYQSDMSIMNRDVLNCIDVNGTHRAGLSRENTVKSTLDNVGSVQSQSLMALTPPSNTEKRKSDLERDSAQAPKRMYLNGKLTTPARSSFLHHLDELVMSQDELGLLGVAEIVKVQLVLAKLIGACCERIVE